MKVELFALIFSQVHKETSQDFRIPRIYYSRVEDMEEQDFYFRLVLFTKAFIFPCNVNR